MQRAMEAAGGPAGDGGVQACLGVICSTLSTQQEGFDISLEDGTEVLIYAGPTFWRQPLSPARKIKTRPLGSLGPQEQPRACISWRVVREQGRQRVA